MRLIIKLIGVGKRFLPLVKISRYLSFLSRKITYLTHQIQFILEWSVDNPEYFDHYIDLHYQWKKNREAFPMERGVFSSLAMMKNAETLDLCCGDGFNSYYFYSKRSKKVTAIDFDREAIFWAKKNFRASNLEFIIGDIRTDIPNKIFDNIIWDAAIEHFTENEIVNLMKEIKSRLRPEGILSGYTIVEAEHGGKHLHQHEYEFHDKEDLARFLKPYFSNIHIFTTVYASRSNLYFFATDGTLPFEQDWNLIKKG